MAGWLLLAVLTALAALAALALTMRADPEGRAEAGVLFTASLFALLGAPVLLLGYTGLLRPALLAIASPALSLATLFACARGRIPELRERALALARLPRDAFALALGARSLVVLGLAAAALAIVVSAWLTWLAPSESWDGLFYHEPIVGFALQNRGFRMVELPPSMVVQAINGYPRLGESVALFFVAFTDRTLIEIGNTLAAPGLMLAVYALVRRHGDDPVPAMGWASIALLLPAVLTQLRTSMIDVEVAFFLLAALLYATRPVLRVRDALAATLAMTLLVASKSIALAWVPPLAIVTWGRLLLAARSGAAGATKRALAAIAGGSLAIAGVAALTFVRNWIAFKDPFWPVSYTNARLGLDFRGLVTLAQISPDPPLRTLVTTKYHQPTGGIGDIIARDYGYGVPWVLVPLAVIAIAVAIAVAVRARLARRPDRDAERALFIVALAAVFTKVSPSLNIARYNVEIIAVGMALVAWLARRLGPRFHEGAVAATLVMTLVPMVWTDWFFGVDLTFRDIAALRRAPAAARASMNVASFQMPAETARLREAEVGQGDLVVFTQETAFPGALFNHAMSNHLAYVRFTTAPAFLARLDALAPRWVVVPASGAARAALESRPGAWQLVGVAVRQDKTVAFRRRTGERL